MLSLRHNRDLTSRQSRPTISLPQRPLPTRTHLFILLTPTTTRNIFTATLTVMAGIMTTAGHTLVPRFLSDFIHVTVTILEAIVILGGMAVDCMDTTIVIPDHMRIATIIRGHIM